MINGTIKGLKLATLFMIIVSNLLTLPFNALELGEIGENSRTNQLNIKVVFIGLDKETIDTSYQNWSNPSYKYQSILIPGISTKVVFSFNYTYVVADDNFNSQFISYLNSISTTETKYNMLWNLTYSLQHGNYFENRSSFEITARNTFYDADKTANYLETNAQKIGGVPENGYLLYIIDLHNKLPSFTTEQYTKIIHNEPAEATPHYYNKTYTDPDLKLKMNRRWMTAWGQNRTYFIDLSAGPSMVDQQLPIQLAAEYSHINLGTVYGNYWINQYISDYTYGAVYNLFAPDLIYPINLAEKYTIKILTIDNRTKADPPIEQTVNTDEIQHQLQKLLPFANVTVELRHTQLSDNPDLQKIVKEATTGSRGSTTLPPKTIYPPNAVDLRPIYQWLSESGQNHIKDYFTITRNRQQYDIPVIAFAFQADYNIASTYKELLADKRPPSRDLWGISLYDMVLISHSEYDMKMGDYILSGPAQPGTGLGFTQTIIHESGHMLGLSHPFTDDPTENYIPSVMAYYPYTTSFSQFDKDALLRGFSDDLIMKAHAAISSSSANPLLLTGALRAENKLAESEKRYSQMDYLGALNDAKDALSQLSPLGGAALNIPVIYVTLFAILVVGTLGFVLGYFVYARRLSKNRAYA